MYDCANVCRELVERLKADPNVRDKVSALPTYLNALLSEFRPVERLFTSAPAKEL